MQLEPWLCKIVTTGQNWVTLTGSWIRSHVVFTGDERRAPTSSISLSSNPAGKVKTVLAALYAYQRVKQGLINLKYHKISFDESRKSHMHEVHINSSCGAHLEIQTFKLKVAGISSHCQNIFSVGLNLGRNRYNIKFLINHEFNFECPNHMSANQKNIHFLLHSGTIRKNSVNFP